MLKLASWNVNSLKVRLEQVIDWIQSSNVDILALQETKLTDDQFPVESFNEIGFQTVYSGQKTYNGVAILSRNSINEVVTDIPSFVDPQRRILAATIGDIRVINLYVPNGFEPGSEKYSYKLSWLQHVSSYIQLQLQQYPKVAVVGDFNIAPTAQDVHDPEAFAGGVLVSELEREAFSYLLGLGLSDSFRELLPDEQQYSWWDYRAGGFRRNHGARIDHILLNENLKKVCNEVGIDLVPRKAERPSDHAPVWVILAGE